MRIRGGWGRCGVVLQTYLEVFHGGRHFRLERLVMIVIRLRMVLHPNSINFQRAMVVSEGWLGLNP